MNRIINVGIQFCPPLFINMQGCVYVAEMRLKKKRGRNAGSGVKGADLACLLHVTSDENILIRPVFQGAQVTGQSDVFPLFVHGFDRFVQIRVIV